MIGECGREDATGPFALTSDVMPRTGRSLPQAEQARLDRIRHQAQQTLIEALSGAPGASDDILGTITWYATIVGVDHPATHTFIAAARDQRWAWRDIAIACGLPDNRGTADALALSHRRRR